MSLGSNDGIACFILRARRTRKGGTSLIPRESREAEEVEAEPWSWFRLAVIASSNIYEHDAFRVFWNFGLTVGERTLCLVKTIPRRFIIISV